MIAQPQTPSHYKALGDRRLQDTDFAGAEAAYLEALRRMPRSLGAALGLAQARRGAGKIGLAVEGLEAALRLNEAEPSLLATFGAALIESGSPARALEVLKQARALAPGNALAAYNLGNALRVMGRFTESETHYRDAVALKPRDAEARTNLAISMAHLGRVSEAVSLLQEALRMKPDDLGALRNLLSISLYDPALTTAELYDRTKKALRFWPAIPETARPAGRLRPPWRVGWLSSDLRDHPVARNILPVIKHIDRSTFRHVFYSDAGKADAVTAQFRSLTDRWRDTARLSDAALADLIRRDEINILVVLAGRFDLNRLAFARYRAAPIQMSFHDVATSALPEMDYFIGDPFLVPPRLEKYFTERVVRLPRFYIHDAINEAPPVAPPPFLRHRHLTFGCFGNPLKINDGLVRLWAHLLTAVPKSRIRLRYLESYASPDVRGRITAQFAEQGVSPERIEFLEKANSQIEHLHGYSDIDVALDTFPFSGSTTTFEALWMGVPVVTMSGDMPVSRWSGSMLRALQLDDLIAANDDDYFAIARRLAEQPARLIELRPILRDRLLGSSLCNGALRGRQVGRLFEALLGRQRNQRRKTHGRTN